MIPWKYILGQKFYIKIGLQLFQRDYPHKITSALHS
jgi:hypothetical protein